MGRRFEIAQSYIAILATLLVGVAFIVSAVLKMRSLDSFELYIFSFEVVSLNVASLISRVIVGVELVLGLGYLLGIYHKRFFCAIFSSLIAFTLFLVVVTLMGREDNCHCFGELVDISPMESILKNVVLMGLLWLSRDLPAWRAEWVYRAQSYVMLSLCAIALYPIFRHPPRSLFETLHGKGGSGNVQVELFEQFIESNPEIGWGEQTKVILFYGTFCKYCRYSTQQISQIVRRNNLSTTGIKPIFMGSTVEQIEEFFNATNSVAFDCMILSPKALLDITNGKIPTMILYDPSSEVGFTTRITKSIDEREIVELLSE